MALRGSTLLRNRVISLRSSIALICGGLVAAGSWVTSVVVMHHGLVSALLIGLVFGVVAGWVGWWIGGRLLRPLATLTQTVRQAKDAATYDTALPSTAFSEVNAPIVAFNALLADLIRHRQELISDNASLERRVRERTLELVLINDSLQNEIEERSRLEIEREGLMTNLLELASIDHLTQTFNRRTLFQLGIAEFDRCRLLELPLTVIMLDIDQFKQVNDTYGHAAGDEILQTVAKHLHTYVRENDIIGRYGGEEFVFVLPDTALEGSIIVAERLRAGVIEASQSTSLGPKFHLTASLGIATLLPEIADFSALVTQADHAHYAAKRGGKDQISIAPQTLLAQGLHAATLPAIDGVADGFAQGSHGPSHGPSRNTARGPFG